LWAVVSQAIKTVFPLFGLATMFQSSLKTVFSRFRAEEHPGAILWSSIAMNSAQSASPLLATAVNLFPSPD